MSSGLRKSNNAQNYVLDLELIWMTGQGGKKGMKQMLQFIKETVFFQLPGPQHWGEQKPQVLRV